MEDLRYAFRTMAANKTFSALAILSLALGIGANTAIYSFMDAILLRSLPVTNPESLVVLNWHNKVRFRGTVMHGGSGHVHTDPKTGSTAGIFPFTVFELFRKSRALFSSVFAYHPTRQVHLLLKRESVLSR